MNTRHVRYGCLESLMSSLSAAGRGSTAVMSVDMLVFLTLFSAVVSFFLTSVLPPPRYMLGDDDGTLKKLYVGIAIGGAIQGAQGTHGGQWQLMRIMRHQLL